MKDKIPKNFSKEFEDVYNAISGALLSQSPSFDKDLATKYSALYFLRNVLKLTWDETQSIYEKEYGLGLLSDIGTRAQIGLKLLDLKKKIVLTPELMQMRPEIDDILSKQNDFAVKYIDKLLKLQEMLDVVADSLHQKLQKDIDSGQISTEDLLKIYTILSSRLVDTASPVIDAAITSPKSKKPKSKHVPADVMRKVLEVYDHIKKDSDD